MKLIKFVPLLLVLFALTSCYHAKITTGAEPSAKIIDQPWASGFIFGLVPPKEVNTASECPNGVAMVETKISFLNGLVSAITFNIYTPMHITVTCASGSGMTADLDRNILIPKNSTEDEVVDAFIKASKQTVTTMEPVFVTFEK